MLPVINTPMVYLVPVWDVDARPGLPSDVLVLTMVLYLYCAMAEVCTHYVHSPEFDLIAFRT